MLIVHYRIERLFLEPAGEIIITGTHDPAVSIRLITTDIPRIAISRAILILCCMPPPFQGHVRLKPLIIGERHVRQDASIAGE